MTSCWPERMKLTPHSERKTLLAGMVAWQTGLDKGAPYR